MIDRFTPDTLRLYLLSHPYHASIDFDEGDLTPWSVTTTRLQQRTSSDRNVGQPQAEVDRLTAEFMRAMDNDFDVRSAISALLGLANLQLTNNDALRAGAAAALHRLSDVLGLSLS